jgi:putative inorganic carbon (hco3(-)) transporter
MALRELLLILTVLALSCAALVRPKTGVYAYIWFAVMRPDVLAWCADNYNFSMMLAVATFIGSVRFLHRIPVLFTNPVVRLFLLLQIPLALSAVFAVIPALSVERYVDYLKSMAVLLLVPLFIETAQDLRVLLLIVGASVGVIGMRFGLFSLFHGGLILIDGYGGQMSDNNLVALALAMSVPLLWYGRTFTESRILKTAILCMLPVCIATIVMTNSRGGSLALGSVFLLIAARSKQKVITLAVLLTVAGGAIYLVRDQYLARMSTIATYNQEASAYSRVEHARAAVKMWQDYPVLGVGFGGNNYSRLSAKYLGREDIHVVHNTYLQMLVDSGALALVIYVVLLYGTILWLGVSAYRTRRLWPGYESLPISIQLSLIAFAVGGTFYSSQRYDLTYIILMGAAAWHGIVGRAQAEHMYEEQQNYTAETGDGLESESVSVPVS